MKPAPYKGGPADCPGSHLERSYPIQATETSLMGLVNVLGGDAVVILGLVHRHGIDAGKPAVEVNIGATPAAERPMFLHGWLAADWTRLGAGLGGGCGHGPDMGTPRC